MYNSLNTNAWMNKYFNVFRMYEKIEYLNVWTYEMSMFECINVWRFDSLNVRMFEFQIYECFYAWNVEMFECTKRLNFSIFQSLNVWNFRILKCLNIEWFEYVLMCEKIECAHV